MKGTVRRGDEFIEFDVNDVNFSGSCYTYVNFSKERASKEDLMRARLSGLIEGWSAMSYGFEVKIDSKKIEWED